jgi:hypothetical protein
MYKTTQKIILTRRLGLVDEQTAFTASPMMSNK